MFFSKIPFRKDCGFSLQKIYEKIDGHPYFASGLLFLVYLGCLAAYCSLEGWHLSRDAITYLQSVERASAEYFYSYPQDVCFPPLLVICMVHAHHWLGISCETAGFGICLFCGALSPVLISVAVKRIFHNDSLAFLGGLLFFLIPGVRDICTNILRDAPSLCLNLAALCCYVFSRYTNLNRYQFFCGFLLIAAVFFRYENIEFLIGIPLLNFLLDLFENTDRSFRTYIKKEFYFLVWFAAGCLCCSVLIFLICWNTDFFTMEKFHSIQKRYLYFF